MTKPSVFSRMVSGEIVPPLVYENDSLFIMLDQNPVSVGHALVVPKVQIDQLDDCSQELYTALFVEVQVLSKLLKNELNPKRVGIVVSGFEVAHAHIHVVPLYTGKELHIEGGRPEGLAKDQAPIFALAQKLAQQYRR